MVAVLSLSENKSQVLFLHVHVFSTIILYIFKGLCVRFTVSKHICNYSKIAEVTNLQAIVNEIHSTARPRRTVQAPAAAAAVAHSSTP